MRLPTASAGLGELADHTATPANTSATPRAITTSRRLRPLTGCDGGGETRKGIDSQSKRDSKAAQSHLSSYRESTLRSGPLEACRTAFLPRWLSSGECEHPDVADLGWAARMPAQDLPARGRPGVLNQRVGQVGRLGDEQVVLVRRLARVGITLRPYEKRPRQSCQTSRILNTFSGQPLPSGPPCCRVWAGCGPLLARPWPSQPRSRPASRCTRPGPCRAASSWPSVTSPPRSCWAWPGDPDRDQLTLWPVPDAG
jgi:hypothetical protein